MGSEKRITYETVLITPEMAEKIMLYSKEHFINRRESPTIIKKYAQDMRDGRWIPNGDTIAMTSEGVLINGYHRMLAVILAGVTIPFTIAHGVDKNAYDVIDIGKKRILSDLLENDGYVKYSKQVGPAAKLLCSFLKEGKILANGSYAGKKISLKQIRALVKNWYEKLASGAACYSTQKMVFISQSCFIVLWVLFGFVSEEKRNVFFCSLQEGSNLASDDPILLLRNILIGLRTARGMTVVDREVESAYIIKAWNAFYVGKKIKQLKKNNNEVVSIYGFDRDAFIAATPGLEL